MRFDDLRDEQILIGLDFIVGGTRYTLAQLIGYLAVVLSRRLYEREYRSLHDYCVRGLKMSTADATRRTQAAHLALRFPFIIDMLKHGTLRLDELCLMTESAIEDLARPPPPVPLVRARRSTDRTCRRH